MQNTTQTIRQDTLQNIRRWILLSLSVCFLVLTGARIWGMPFASSDSVSADGQSTPDPSSDPIDEQ